MGCVCGTRRRVALDASFDVKGAPATARQALLNSDNWLRIVPGRSGDTITVLGSPDAPTWVLSGRGGNDIRFTDFVVSGDGGGDGGGGGGGAAADSAALTLAYNITVGPADAPVTTLNVSYAFAPLPGGGTCRVRRLVVNQRVFGAYRVVACVVFSQTQAALARENDNMRRIIDDAASQQSS